MKQLTKSMGIMAMALLAVACTGKKQNVENGKVIHGSMAWAGTYAGVTRAADCPGIYRMVATDGADCEVMDKYLERRGIYVSRGSVTRNNDTVRIDDVPYNIGKGMLYNSIDTLYRISDEKKLPALYTTQWMMDNNGGGMASVKCFFEEGKRKAELSFKGKVYNMLLNDKNSQVNEYVEGIRSLVMERIDPAPLEVETPVFMDGEQRYEFVVTSPVNQLFTATNAPALDVLYMNDDNGHVVMLLSADRKECRILEQTEASAKSAVYSDGTATWNARGDRATLTVGGKTIEYSGKGLMR